MNLCTRLGEVTRKESYAYNEVGEAIHYHEVKKYIEESRWMSGVLVDPKIAFLIFLYKIRSLGRRFDLWKKCTRCYSEVKCRYYLF